MPGGNKEIEIIYDSHDGRKGGKGNYENKGVKAQNWSGSRFRQGTRPDEELNEKFQEECSMKENSTPSLQLLKKPFFIRSCPSEPFPNRPNWNAARTQQNGMPHNK